MRKEKEKTKGYDLYVCADVRAYVCAYTHVLL